jgi:SAP domain-containing ribonucleoprotein
MSNYAKLKNDELQGLLRDRGLPTTGKKADMVDRLTKDDENKTTADQAPAHPNAHPEDEIDWDDEDAQAPATKDTDTKASAPADAAVAAPDALANADSTAKPTNPQAVPNQKAALDPSTTDDLSVKPPVDSSEPKEPAPSYAAGLAATDLDAEIEKRKKRAARFGTKLEDDETLKKLERAKKFGEVGPPKGLDEALPERERKRAREDNDDAGRNKRRGGARPAGATRGSRDGRGANRDGDRRRDTRRDEKRSDNGSGGNWMSAADRERAEARKAKWTAKPAATS